MDIMKFFRPSEGAYRNVMAKLDSDMNMGLDPAQRDKACIKMYPSYVTRIPTGKGRS